MIRGKNKTKLKSHIQLQYFTALLSTLSTTEVTRKRCLGYTAHKFTESYQEYLKYRYNEFFIKSEELARHFPRFEST